MTQDLVLQALREALLTAAMVAAPLLLAVLIVGLLISILQVATQIQEMTLTFVPKLIVSVVMLLVFGGWMLSLLRQFALSVITRAASL
ncbi:flagellar biosynthetic protein FliQ [Pseudomonas putida]|uniref:flagellar biosynthetic protein FliQ n=1 Tax=Pseudomonas TaxID=286 RepID=UPI000BA4CF0A|nr:MULTISPECIES: flagellar biosynthetic protein FliQ [Pseudomonas]EKT4477141.1 flagellar biosynthetic protein FliQ [Pseudomonas putida]WPK02546.1 flagellar biosynthetic protein FliQ [Pseudomonas putida]